MEEGLKKPSLSSPEVVCTDSFFYVNGKRISGAETNSVKFERVRGCKLVTVTLSVYSFDDRRIPVTDDFHEDARLKREVWDWEVETFGHPKKRCDKKHLEQNGHFV